MVHIASGRRVTNIFVIADHKILEATMASQNVEIGRFMHDKTCYGTCFAVKVRQKIPKDEDYYDGKALCILYDYSHNSNQ